MYATRALYLLKMRENYNTSAGKHSQHKKLLVVSPVYLLDVNKNNMLPYVAKLRGSCEVSAGKTKRFLLLPIMIAKMHTQGFREAKPAAILA